MSRILVTGSEGLLGRALSARLAAEGHALVRMDLRAADEARGDVCDRARVARALAGCDGVVHLAAVSRVAWAEERPSLCRATNVAAVRELCALALAATPRPWLVFASSREVYGQAQVLPVKEDAPLAPLNVYGRAKLAGEALCREAAEAGLRVAIGRFSNVFGSAADHPDRVVPAFVRAALSGAELRLDGPESGFDFTHVDDAVAGLGALVAALADGAVLPPIHFTTGVPTTLADLAARIVRLAGSRSALVAAPRPTHHVERFCGDPARARALLGWSARVPLDEGLARLIAELTGRL